VPMFLSFQALRNQGQMVSEVSLAHLSPLKRENINLTGGYTGEDSWLVGAFRLPRDDGVRFPDRAAFIAGSFQAFVCDLRPKLLQRPRCRLVRMPFGVVRSPRHPTMPLTNDWHYQEVKSEDEHCIRLPDACGPIWMAMGTIRAQLSL
jgi:hypothetical protein